MDIENLRKEKIDYLKKSKEVILTDLDLQLLMYDSIDREDNGNYSDIIWFKIFRNIAMKNKASHNILDNINLSESELLLMNLIEDGNIDEIYRRYHKLLINSKDTIGIKLDKDEINNLLNMITNNKPSEEENNEYYMNIKKNYENKNNGDNVIYHKF